MLDAFERRRQVPSNFRGRIAVGPSDPGYANYANLIYDGYQVRIFLDDIEQTYCLVADPNEGQVTRGRTVHGKPLYFNGVAQIETVKGNVTIRLER